MKGYSDSPKESKSGTRRGFYLRWAVAVLGAVGLAVVLLLALQPSGQVSAQEGDGEWWSKHCKFHPEDCDFDHRRDGCDDIRDWRRWDDDDHDVQFVRDRDGCLRVIIIKKEVTVLAPPAPAPQTIVVQTQPVVIPPAQPQIIVIPAQPQPPSAPPPPFGQQVRAAAPAPLGQVAPPRTGDGGLIGRDNVAGLPANAEFGVVLGFIGLAIAGYAYRMRPSNS